MLSEFQHRKNPSSVMCFSKHHGGHKYHQSSAQSNDCSVALKQWKVLQTEASIPLGDVPEMAPWNSGNNKY